jgi:hypothetical protein
VSARALTSSTIVEMLLHCICSKVSSSDMPVVMHAAVFSFEGAATRNMQAVVALQCT